MAILLQVLNNESKQKMEIGIDETFTILKLMQKFSSDGIIDVSKPYYLKTIGGIIYSPDTIFRAIKEKEFILVQDIPPSPPAFLQLGIFVIDGSASMREGAINGKELPVDVVNEALKKTISRFKVSSHSRCFSFAVVAFGDSAKVILTPQNVTDIELNQSFIATDYFNKGEGSESTNISAGLVIASELADKFFKNSTNNLIHKAVVVVLTDGMCHHEKETRDMANVLRQMPGVEIYSCHLETRTNEAGAVNLLKDISNHYKTVYDEESIRNFFEHSIYRKRG